MSAVRTIRKSDIFCAVSISKITGKSAKCHTIYMITINPVGTLQIESKTMTVVINKTYIWIKVLLVC